MPKPNENKIFKNNLPDTNPDMKGIVLIKPFWAPEESNNKLAGPGVPTIINMKIQRGKYCEKISYIIRLYSFTYDYKSN